VKRFYLYFNDILVTCVICRDMVEAIPLAMAQHMANPTINAWVATGLYTPYEVEMMIEQSRVENE